MPKADAMARVGDTANDGRPITAADAMASAAAAARRGDIVTRACLCIMGVHMPWLA
jgi:orotidine-5'-phosphate decarboxylase